MKVLCVVPSYYPAFKYGGPIFSVHGLNKALVKKGIDITVYTTNVGLGGRVPVNSEVDVEGVKVFYFAFMKFFEFFGETGWQFSKPMKMAIAKNLLDFDIVYIVAIWNCPIAIAAYYCRKYKKPYIISPQGFLYPYTISKKFWKKWIYYISISKKDIENASAVHYTTEDEKEKCHSFLRLKNEAVSISNGIDMSEFKDLPERAAFRNRYTVLRDRKVILFLGRINWKKGLDILAKAYGKIAKKRDDVYLVIAGNDEGGYERKVRYWLKKEGVLDRTLFTGMLTGRDKLEAYAGSDIFVLSSYSENFGMSVIEAMACGLPVIISNQVGIHKEVAQANAGIIINTESEQLVAALRNLLDNAHVCKNMGENGRSLIEDRFTLDRVADEMIELCREIISRRIG